MTMRAILGVLGLSMLGACAGSAIDVGPGAAGAAATTSALGGAASIGGSGNAAGAAPVTCKYEKPLPVWPSDTACAGSNDLPLVGSWRGYAEGAQAPWDELFLEIKGANSNGLCGTLRIGSAEPPPPATDPDVTYPPGVVVHNPDYFIRGATLTLLDGSTDGTRVRFRVANAESYDGWCRMQTVYSDDGICSCVRRGTLISDINNNHCTMWGKPIDCGKAQMCGASPVPICYCNSVGCAAEGGTGYSFDFRVNGDTAEGSGPNERVYFTRVH